VGRPSKYSRETFIAYLDAIENGAYQWQAAQRIGVNPLTIQRWCKGKPGFAEAVREAERRSLDRELAQARHVGALGNWRLTRMLLAKKYPDAGIEKMSERQVKELAEVELAAAWNAQRKATPAGSREHDASDPAPSARLPGSPESLSAETRPVKPPKPETELQRRARLSREAYEASQRDLVATIARAEQKRKAEQEAVYQRAWSWPTQPKWSPLDPHADARYAGRIALAEATLRSRLG
jgi:hypothetical protein